MGKLDKYLKPKVVVEKGEYLRNNAGQVMQVSQKMPTHDDTQKVTAQGTKKVKKGQGGVELEGIESVVSATQENRNQKDSTYTVVDDSIKLRPQDAQDWAMSKFGIKIAKPKSSLSFSKAITLVKDQVDIKVKKYEQAFPEASDKLVLNATKANKEVLETLPSLEDIYEQALQDQEALKIPVQQQNAQVGMDNTAYRPQLKNKFLLQQKQDLDKALTLDPKAEEAFRAKYKTSSHMFRMKNDPNYEKKILNQAKKNPQQLNYPANDTRRADYVAPNNRFMYPNLKGEAEANMVNQTNEFIAGELAGAIPLTSSAKKISELSSAPKLIDGLKEVPSKIKTAFDNIIVEPLAAAVNKKNGIDGKEASTFLKNWYDDPETKSRLYNLSNDDLAAEFYNHPPEKIKFKSLLHAPEDVNTLGRSFGDFDNLYMNNKALYKNKAEFNSTGVHEGTHALTTNGRMFTDTENDMLLKPFGTDYNNYQSNIKYDKEFGTQKYLLDPTEIHARINEARFNLNKKPTDLVTEDEITSLIEKNNFFGMGSLIKDKSKMADLMNKFYGVSGAGVVSSQIDNKQVGGELEKRIEKGKKWFKKKDSEGKYPKTREVFTAQAGTKTKLKSYPYMKGSRPALGTTSGRSIESLDGRSISMDQIYDADSVEVLGEKAKTFYKSKLQKYLKK